MKSPEGATFPRVNLMCRPFRPARAKLPTTAACRLRLSLCLHSGQQHSATPQTSAHERSFLRSINPIHGRHRRAPATGLSVTPRVSGRAHNRPSSTMSGLMSQRSERNGPGSPSCEAISSTATEHNRVLSPDPAKPIDAPWLFMRPLESRVRARCR